MIYSEWAVIAQIAESRVENISLIRSYLHIILA